MLNLKLPWKRLRLTAKVSSRKLPVYLGKKKLFCASCYVLDHTHKSAIDNHTASAKHAKLRQQTMEANLRNVNWQYGPVLLRVKSGMCFAKSGFLCLCREYRGCHSVRVTIRLKGTFCRRQRWMVGQKLSSCKCVTWRGRLPYEKRKRKKFWKTSQCLSSLMKCQMQMEDLSP